MQVTGRFDHVSVTASYSLDEENLSVTTDENDLGVLVDNRLHYDKHIRGIVKTENCPFTS